MSDSESINGLGSRSSVIQAVSDADKRGLSRDELALVASIGTGARLGAVLERSGMPEAKAISLLLGLRLRGVVHPAPSRAGPVYEAGSDESDGRVPLSVPMQSRAFGPTAPARPGVASAPAAWPASNPRATPSPGAPATKGIDLAALGEEVDLDDARKREVLELEARLGTSDFFALLGVGRNADPAVVKKAYYELTKRFHPDRFFGKSIGSFKGRIERIFKRITEAQAVLTDPAKRKAYLAEHPELAPASVARAVPAAPRPDDPRAAERRARLARHPYLAKRAKFNELVSHGRAALAAGQFDRALAELSLAAQIEPDDPELGKLQAEAKKGGDRGRAETEFNEGRSSEQMGDWTIALTHLRRAVQLAPDNARFAHYLARVLAAQESLEALKEAHGHARRASELEPENADFHSTFGGILVRAGLEKNALREYEQVLRLRPGDEYARDQVRRLRLKTKLF